MGEASALGRSQDAVQECGCPCSFQWDEQQQPFFPLRDRPGWGAVEGRHPVQRDATSRGCDSSLRAGRRRGAGAGWWAGAGWSPRKTLPKGSPDLRLATQTEVTAFSHVGFLPSSLCVIFLLNGSG